MSFLRISNVKSLALTNWVGRRVNVNKCKDFSRNLIKQNNELNNFIQITCHTHGNKLNTCGIRTILVMKIMYMNQRFLKAVGGLRLNGRHSYHTSEIRIYEVGPRDGLQNEAKFVPTDIKLKLIDKLAAAGIKDIESASFVSPKWVKQMSDGVEVMKNLNRLPGVNYPVLVPNLKGYGIAKECNVEEIAIFPAGSEGFSQKNLNCSVEEGLRRFKEVADQAVKDGLRVRGYVSCVVGCPYDGPVSPKIIAKITEDLLKMGCYEVSLGDTIGVGTAGSVRRLMKEVLTVAPPETLALHFHDTYGQGLSNLLAGLEFGIKTVDSSISGLGGCPYARGASGNLATEDLVYFLYGLGVNTNIDLVKLVEAGRFISNFLGKPTESRVNRALGDKFKDSKQIVNMAACDV